MLERSEIQALLDQFGINSFGSSRFVDSSHGETDVRHNYIIDDQYVLRLNSARVMDDDRIDDLDRLIQRYRQFGLQAPCFLKNKKGNYVVESGESSCYLSEYLDLTVADDVKERCRESLIVQRVTMVADFAEKYRDVDLMETRSMYSLFELSPYDALLCGVDEKQDNCNTLVADLKDHGMAELAAEVTKCNEQIRQELLSFYKELPKCVFQGDENFSNLCVDERDRITGLFDFNMAGTEVIANYLANIALQGNFFYTDEIFAAHSADEIFDKVRSAYQKNTELIRREYQFTQQEFYAYQLYTKIVILFGYCNQCAYSYYIKSEENRGKVVELLCTLLRKDL